MKRGEIRYLECACTSSEHVVRVCIEDDEFYPMFISVQLSGGSFFRRLWEAVRHLLGYDCKYGHWDEVLLNRDGIRRLQLLCRKALENEHIGS